MSNEVTTLSRGAVVDIERLAEAVAKSGMFGIKTREQALVLMSIAQAEGRHPAEAARDYHVIGGRPAKTAEAMMRDFLKAGGRVEWHDLSDVVADATFSHPAGGSVRILWDQAAVKRAGLQGREGHQKYPRAMLRARCVSEGVRTVYPAATSGAYVPEEVGDMPAILPAASASDTGDLDEFAAAAERIPARDILAEAREAAGDGTVLFREFWAGLSPTERDGIRQHLDEFKTDAEVADKFAAKRARAAANNPDDPFGLPPLQEDHLTPAEPAPPIDLGEIAMPLKAGKRDWRTWALALLGPKVRGCTASNELADLLGANEHNLEEARAVLAPADRAELERIIAEQWERLPA